VFSVATSSRARHPDTGLSSIGTATLPALGERVFRFALQYCDLLGVTPTQILDVRHHVSADLAWCPAPRFPRPTSPHLAFPFDLYRGEQFAALELGAMLVGASTLGQKVYIYGPTTDPVTALPFYGVLAAEPLYPP
jgi:hypothetical protein